MKRIGFLIVFISCASFTFASINTSEAVEIGGIKQWVKFQGVDQKAPVLLFLHGGPGNSALAYSDKFTSELTKHFLVVIWDQRESGKTAKLNASTELITIALIEADAIEMIQYLRSRFSQDKIYLMGHSWGGFLALRVATHQPELLTACLAISPMVHQVESERMALQWMLTQANESKNEQAIEELAKVEIPFENADQLYYHRKWITRFQGNKFPSKAFVSVWGKKWLPLFNEASCINFFEVAPEIKCPVYFLLGSNDYQTNHVLTESYYKLLACEGKKLSWFTNSSHNPHLTESEKFQKTVIAILNQN
jgi:pimeloyl-ACP methyl ester carboxylesterase